MTISRIIMFFLLHIIIINSNFIIIYNFKFKNFINGNFNLTLVKKKKMQAFIKNNTLPRGLGYRKVTVGCNMCPGILVDEREGVKIKVPYSNFLNIIITC